MLWPFAKRNSLFQSLIFFGGYVFAKGRRWQRSPARYVDLHLPGWVLSHEPELPVSLAKDADRWVLVIGYALDTDNASHDASKIASALLDALDTNEFFERVDALSGRHVVVFSSGGGVSALTDATGMKSVFYINNRPGVIASHPALLSPRRSGEPIPFRFGYPGIRTPFRDIRLLTANTLLRLQRNTVERFFPRAPIEMRPVASVRDEVERLVGVQIGAVTSGYPRTIMSLTAGIDSRTILAASRRWWQGFEFFTYVSSAPDQRIDSDVATEIASRLGLNHRIINYETLSAGPGMEEFSDFSECYDHSVYDRGSPRLHYWYWKQFSSGGRPVHIRSNIAEVGRAFWRKWHKDTHLDLPLSRMVSVYASNLATKLSPRQVEYASELFSEFRGVAHFDDIHNFDPYDMFYWEHRMPQWHAQVCVEADPAFDTFVPFNCRRLLTCLLSVPLEHRIGATVFRDIVAANLPELADIPINPKTLASFVGATQNACT